jgi:uncharacterized membrane protein YoaK (UPF0700 family)
MVITMDCGKKELYLHSIMCVVGGFFGSYAIVNGFENMGSAQTTNMIEVVCTIFGKNYSEFLLRILAFILYISAIVICIFLEKRTNINLHKYAISVEIIIMIGLVFMPKHIDPLIGLLPIFFMMSTQWSVFRGIGKYNSATIFSTNNLRQCVCGFTEYILNKKPGELEKGKFFANSLLWFHIGVAISYICCKQFGNMASLFAIPIAVVAYIVEIIPQDINRKISRNIKVKA